MTAAEKGFWRQMARMITAPETATAVARATPCEVMREEEEDIRRKNGVRVRAVTCEAAMLYSPSKKTLRECNHTIRSVGGF